MTQIEATLAGLGWITSAKAAEILNVDRSYIRWLVHRGLLTAERSGRDIYLSEIEVLLYRESHPRVGQRRKTA